METFWIWTQRSTILTAFSNIETEANTEYVITFDFRSHTTVDPNATADTNGFQVWFNGELVGQYSADEAWQTGSIVVTSSQAGPTELLFCEIEEGEFNSGDSRGAFLDNIRVMKVGNDVVTNGSFETTFGERTTFFQPFEVEGWGAFGETEAVRILQLANNSGSEIDTSFGQRYLNLDTQSGHQDGVYQDIATTAGTTYLLRFDYRTDGDQGNSGSAATQDEFRVRWNGSWVGTFVSEGEWTSVGSDCDFDSGLYPAHVS